jgi:anti-sigma factor (TIGR02949 family)
MRCADVEKLVQPFVDGEVDGPERADLERHIASCVACSQQVAFQESFKAGLRSRLRVPAPPPELRARVLDALDRADALGQGPARPARRLWPFALVPATAAAAALVVLLLFSGHVAEADPSVVDLAIRGHEKNLPVEIVGDEEAVRVWMNGKVPVPVRPPHMAQASLVGARVGHIASRDAAQIVYRVGRSHVTVYVFDPAGMVMTAPRYRVVDGRRYFVGGARGYNVVLVADHGVGYVFTSDLDGEAMLQLASASLNARQ